MAQFAIRNLFKEVAVSDEEIKVYYDENQAQFKKGETVSAKHILVESEEKCNPLKPALLLPVRFSRNNRFREFFRRFQFHCYDCNLCSI